MLLWDGLELLVNLVHRIGGIVSFPLEGVETDYRPGESLIGILRRIVALIECLGVGAEETCDEDLVVTHH